MFKVRSLPQVRPPFDSELGGRFADERGELAQVFNAPGGISRLSYLEFREPGLPRGNHYHVGRVEWLYIVRGCLEAYFEDRSGKLLGSAILRAGDLLSIQPECAHVVVPLEYSQAIEFSPAVFDITDTRPHRVDVDARRSAERSRE